jgi:hypothetical protein
MSPKLGKDEIKANLALMIWSLTKKETAGCNEADRLCIIHV